MQSKILIITILLFFLPLNLHSFSLDINGNNIIWSPVSDFQFIYSVYGKSSGKTIWKMYDLKKKKSETIYYGNSLLPQWSFDGKSVVFIRGDLLMVNSKGKIDKEYKMAVAEPASFDWSLKGDKITYSDGEKIYVLEMKKNNNYFVIKGESPLFIDNDKKIIYFDEDMKVNIVDESLKSKVIFPDIVKKILPIKKENKFLFQAGRMIKLYDLSDDIIYTVVKDGNDIASFNLSYDCNFLTYNNNAGEHFIVHIPTMRKIPLVTDKKFFTQKLSGNSKYCAFEKEGQIHIKDIKSFIDAFNLKDIYKISFGAIDGISAGASLEVFQEKKNPFTGKLAGYDAQNFKGTIKVIAVYNGHSYGMKDKKSSVGKQFEVGDVVLWKEQNKMGIIQK